MFEIFVTVIHGIPTKKVLFIGNSLTSDNSLPTRLQEVGNAENSVMRFTSTAIVPDGAFIYEHVDKTLPRYTGALGEIEKGGWDYVVIQEQSGNWFQFYFDSYPSPSLLAAAVKKVNAAPIFLATWPDRGVADFISEQNKITDAYSTIAALNSAYCAPCGDALRALRKVKSVNFIYKDIIHPSYAAQVSNAYVLYSTMTGSSPVGLQVTLNINALDNTLLQQNAWQTYTTYRSLRNDSCVFSRMYGVLASCVQFVNESTPQPITPQPTTEPPTPKPPGVYVYNIVFATVGGLLVVVWLLVTFAF